MFEAWFSSARTLRVMHQALCQHFNRRFLPYTVESIMNIIGAFQLAEKFNLKQFYPDPKPIPPRHRQFIRQIIAIYIIHENTTLSEERKQELYQNEPLASWIYQKITHDLALLADPRI